MVGKSNAGSGAMMQRYQGEENSCPDQGQSRGQPGRNSGNRRSQKAAGLGADHPGFSLLGFYSASDEKLSERLDTEGYAPVNLVVGGIWGGLGCWDRSGLGMGERRISEPIRASVSS